MVICTFDERQKPTHPTYLSTFNEAVEDVEKATEGMEALII